MSVRTRLNKLESQTAAGLWYVEVHPRDGDDKEKALEGVLSEMGIDQSRIGCIAWWISSVDGDEDLLDIVHEHRNGFEPRGNTDDLSDLKGWQRHEERLAEELLEA